MQQPPWMAVAWAELGQAERPGAAVNPRILDYFAQLGHATITDDETAWCAAFVGVCLERAGIPSTRSLMARSYLEWGEPAPEPALGAIAVLSRGPDPSLGHVGFVLGTTASGVVLLGGNQSNAVGVGAFDRGRVLAYRCARTGDAPPVRHDQRDFEIALAHVLDMEGGWSDDPFDQGGPTNKGITLRAYAQARGVPLTPESWPALEAELRRIPDHLVRELYLGRYWRPARCADLPPPVALMHFDAAVNHGVAGAARLLQDALGVGIDGEIGPITLRAAYTRPVCETLRLYAAARRRRYRSLPHFWRFGRGWLRRVEATLALALRQPMPPRAGATSATTAKETSPMPDAQANFPSQPNIATEPGAATKWWGQSLTIWGTLLTALSTVLPVLGPVLGLDLTPDLVEQLGADVVLVIQAIGGLIGTLLAIFGRVRATALIERRPVRLRL